MFANIVEIVYPPGRRAAGRAQIEEFQSLVAQQPGHRGTIQVDAGDGRILALTLWDDAAAQESARPMVSAAAERLIRPLGATPARPLGSGEVERDTSAPGAGYARLAATVAAPDHPADLRARADEYRVLVDRQPGALGAIFVATGEGKRMVLRLWASEAQQQASAALLGAAFDRLVAPALAEPAQIVGAGAVVRDTIAHGESSAG